MKHVFFGLCALHFASPTFGADVLANAFRQSLAPPLHDVGPACPATIAGVSSSLCAPVVETTDFSEGVTGRNLSDIQLTGSTTSNPVLTSPNPNRYAATTGPTTATVPAAPPPASDVPLGKKVRSDENKTLRQSAGRAEDRSRNARDRLVLDIRCRDADETEVATPEEFLECDRYQNSLDDPSAATVQAEQGAGNVISNGVVTKQVASADGTYRRLFFGSFDMTHDSDLGSIATLYGEVAWERLTRPDTLLGFFVGAEASLSDVQGVYSGDRQRLGLSGGVYAAHAMQNGLYADGFAVLGYGLNTLDLSDGTVDIDADYTAPTFLLGGALSGERAYERFVLHPEIAFAVGYTDIGNVDYDAGAGPAVADAGYAALARLRLTPEIRMPWTPGTDLYDFGSFDVEPSLICEWVDAGDESSNCGVGLGLELSAQSTNGRHELSGRLAVESIGGSERSRLSIMFESRF